MSGADSSPTELEATFRRVFDSFVSRGIDKTRAAALLLPILAGSPINDVVARANAELASSVTSVSAMSDDAPASMAASDSSRMFQLSRLSLSASRTTELAELCTKAADFSAFSDMLRCGFSIEALSRSFVLVSDLPDLDLGGCAVDVDEPAAADGRRAEKRVRMMSPGRVPAVSTEGASRRPSGSAVSSSDEEQPPLIPISSHRNSAGSASSVSAAGSSTSAPFPVEGGVLPTLGVGRAIRLGGLTTPALTGVASPPIGSPSLQFYGLPRCDVDIAEVFSAFSVISEVASRELRVGQELQGALASVCSQLQSSAPRLGDLPRDVARLRTFLIIASCPSLEDPSFHDSVVSRLCKAFVNLKKRQQGIVSHWFATVGANASEDMLLRLDDPLANVLEGHAAGVGTAVTAGASRSHSLIHGHPASPQDWPKALIQRSVDWCQQYITVRLYEGTFADSERRGVTVNDIAGPVKFLGMLNASAEEFLLLHGRRAVPYTIFYNQVVSEEINLQDDFNRWLAGRRGQQQIFSFCSNAYILDASAKSQVLQYDAARQMEDQYRTHMFQALLGDASGASPIFQLTVRRDHIVEDALQAITNAGNRASLKRPLKVRFAGEEGQDVGGVRKEFFAILCRQLLSPEFGMFIEVPDSHALWFNADSLEAPVQFELVGSLLGLAIYNSVILDVNFPLALYRKLKRETMTLLDLEEMKPDVVRSLRMLLDYDKPDLEDVFCLNFTVTYESWGERKSHDLIPDGSSVSVTTANRKQYVSSYLRWYLTDSVSAQFEAFNRGFANVAGGPALDVFRSEELQLLVVGSQELDFEALEKSAICEAPYSKDHRIIRELWEVVHSLTPAEKRCFLAFCTGSDRSPIRGLGSLRFTISRAGPDSEQLPTSHTCFNHLLLMEYATKEKLERKLRAAIRESEGFGLI